MERSVGNTLRHGVEFLWRGRRWRVIEANYRFITATCLGPAHQDATAFFVADRTLERLRIEVAP